VADPVLGSLSIPGFPLRFSAQPALPALTAPLLGQHNATVLENLLGYTPAQVAELSAAGVLASGDR
jgi:crotonobetainyl-CoA:carnitine CoA-transferase CaiB-like acyl-CoA transferase